MSFFQSTYESDIYHNFKAIEAAEYRSIVHFFEDNEKAIKGLEFEPYFEMLIAYINALFEIGKYEKHLKFSDYAIEISINRNIKYYHNIDIFQHLLFNKAVSYFNLMEYEQSAHILRELVMMNPKDEITVMFLKRCLRKKQPPFINNSRAIAVLLFIISAVVISAEILIVRPNFPNYIALIEGVRTGFFVLGWVVLVGGEAFHLWSVNRKVEQLVSHAKERK